VVRLRRDYRNPAWPYDFVHFQIDDGVIVRALNIPDALRRDCLAIKLDQKLNSTQVTDGLFNGVIF